MRTFKPRHCATCTLLFIPTGPKNIWCSTMCRLLDCCDHSGGEGACWNWASFRDKHGYGYMMMTTDSGRGCEFAHREMYKAFHKSDLVPSQIIRHSCDNTSCINPKHLILGSQADNVSDMWERGRQQTYKNRPRGSSCHRAKITEEIAIAIFNSTGTNVEIAKQFGLKTGMVDYIKRGETWSHATGFYRTMPKKKQSRMRDEDIATDIYEAHGEYQDIADRFGVSYHLVRRIKRGESFSSITGAVFEPIGPRRGSENPKSKITEDDVREILQSDRSSTYFVRKFGIHKNTISAIRNRVSWKHVTI